ncbi:hypothetical protein RhiirA1_484451 [Rhizophagus irregularis]|uniref:Uncharacterized protein n=1 Tax=Rhizophagus irregularis TaxID=588596 RepID=A0A2N0QJB1_9GLOM|nr:hypothetical protein RhiirA1_484451 [Rhizophagus irregularis]
MSYYSIQYLNSRAFLEGNFHKLLGTTLYFYTILNFSVYLVPLDTSLYRIVYQPTMTRLVI